MKAVFRLFGVAVRRSPLRVFVPVAVALMTVVVASLLDRPAATAMQGTSTIQNALLVWLPVVLMLAYLHGRALAISSTHIGYAGEGTSMARFRLPIFVAAAAWCLLGWFAVVLAGAIGLARSGTSTLWVMALNAVAMVLISCMIGTLLAVGRAPIWLAVLSAVLAYVGLVAWNYLPYQSASILFSVYGSQFFSSALPGREYLMLQFIWALLTVVIAGTVLLRRISVVVGMAVLIGLGVGIVLVGTQTPYLTSRSDVIPMACGSHSGTTICLWEDVDVGRPGVEEGVDLAARLVERSRLAPYVVSSDFDDHLPQSISTDARIVRIPVDRTPDHTEVAVGLVLDALNGLDCDDRNLGEIANAVRSQMIPTSSGDAEQATIGELKAWIASKC